MNWFHIHRSFIYYKSIICNFKIKIDEILHFTFDTMSTFNFDSICLHHILKCPLWVCLILKLWIIFKSRCHKKKTFTPLSSHNGRSGSNSNLGIKSKDNKEEEWYPKDQEIDGRHYYHGKGHWERECDKKKDKSFVNLTKISDFVVLVLIIMWLLQYNVWWTSKQWDEWLDCRCMCFGHIWLTKKISSHVCELNLTWHLGSEDLTNSHKL